MGLNLLEQLKASPIGKQLEHDFEAETFKKRKAAADEIKRITAEEAKVLPGLLEAREKAKADVKAAQEAVQKAKKAYDRTFGAVWNVTVRANARRNEQEQILRGSYSEEIDKFKEEMNELLRLTRLKGSEFRDHGGRSPVDDKWYGKVYSNREAVLVRLAYLQAAIAEAEELKLQALEPEKLTARLKEIRRKMPQSGVMQLVS